MEDGSHPLGNTVLKAASIGDVAFDAIHAPVVQHDRVGDDGVDGALRIRRLALAHAVADHLAAAELHLLAVGGEILLDFDEQICVSKPDLVARGRAEHVDVGAALDLERHGVFALVPKLMHRPCAQRGFRCLETGAAYPQ